MDNHYHLLVETLDANLSAGMRQLGGIYTQRFNRRHNEVGHLFQGRYKSILVEKENYLLELSRYIVLNPVRANIVVDPASYSWSSYAATAGETNKPPFLCIDWILAQFGKDWKTAQHQFREFVMAGIGEKSPWNELKGQCLLGGERFLDKLSPYLERKSSETEIPRRARFAGRPQLPKLFPPGQTMQERNTAIAQAHLFYGYSQQEIAGIANLHYSTVSRIVQRERRSKGKT